MYIYIYIAQVLLELQNIGQPPPAAAAAAAVETMTLPGTGTIVTKVNGLWFDNGGRERPLHDGSKTKQNLVIHGTTNVQFHKLFFILFSIFYFYK